MKFTSKELEEIVCALQDAITNYEQSFSASDAKENMKNAKSALNKIETIWKEQEM